MSIISSIGQDAAELILDTASVRSKALFTVGIHDIPHLDRLAKESRNAAVDLIGVDDTMSVAEDGGYIACTSDQLLPTKHELYDVLVDLQPVDSASLPPAPLARITTPPAHAGGASTIIKATSRDGRRYAAFRQDLNLALSQHKQRAGEDHDADSELDSDQQRLLGSPGPAHAPARGNDIDASVIEPQPLVAMVYDAFIWWASAGERMLDLDLEVEHDRDIMRSALRASGVLHMTSMDGHSTSQSADPAVVLAKATIAYFHELTRKIFTTLADILASEDEASEGVVSLSAADLTRMGLDIWSRNDRAFVKELASMYFDVEVRVEGANVECCGVKLY
ncbi:hypothetical protein MRB53_040953 [Persea americana]|nr:hypothetical protein MRB53_040953 [Persea americana]